MLSGIRGVVNIGHSNDSTTGPFFLHAKTFKLYKNAQNV